MKRDILNPERYQYLSKELSDIYDQAQRGEFADEAANHIIISLIIQIRDMTKGEHCASRI